MLADVELGVEVADMSDEVDDAQRARFRSSTNMAARR